MTGTTASSTDAASSGSTGAGGESAAPPELLHQGTGLFRNLAVGGGYLYFGEPTDPSTDLFGAVRRIPIEGGSVETVVVEGERFFAVTDTALYYQEFGELRARAHDDDASTVVVDGDHTNMDLEAMLVADGFVYRAHAAPINGPDPDAFSRVDVASGEVEDLVLGETVATAFFGTPAFAVGSDALVWGRFGGAASVPLEGGDPVDLPGTSGSEVTALAVDGDAIYVVASGPSDGRLVRVRDGAAETLFDDGAGDWGLDFAYAVHVTASWIWVGVGDGLLRFAPDGGEPTLIETEDTVTWITSDNESVYWIESRLAGGAARIQRLAE